jgi:hypothetical protein
MSKERPDPGDCIHQVIGQTQYQQRIGGLGVTQPVICRKRARFSDDGSYCPSLNDGCHFTDNETKCPEFTEREEEKPQPPVTD